MKTKRSFHLPVVFALLIFCFPSCEDYLSEYGEEIIPEGYTKIGSQIINSDGGTIDLQDLSIEVPAGAFGESKEITILKSDENNIPAEHALSDLYMIQGLPGTLSSQITISIMITS